MELSKKLQPDWVQVGEVAFLCAPLTAAQSINITGMIGDESRWGDMIEAVVRYAVKDWRGFTRDGEALPFSAAALADFMATPKAAPMLMELSQAVMARSRLEDADAKN